MPYQLNPPTIYTGPFKTLRASNASKRYLVFTNVLRSVMVLCPTIYAG